MNACTNPTEAAAPTLRSAHAARAHAAFVLAMAAGACAASIAVVTGLQARRAGTTTTVAIAGVPLARDATPAPLAADTGGEREALAPSPGDPAAARVHAPGSDRARRERELREDFVRRQRAKPGYLEGVAASLLASDRLAPEKVALLRALEDVGSAELVRWLEEAVLVAPDQASPQGESVPSLALGRLSARAAREPDARLALLRLAFEVRSLSSPLRCRAAAAAAATCDADGLAALESALRRERDAEVVRNAVVALSGRRAEAPVKRLLTRLDALAAEPAEPTEAAAAPGLE